MASARVKPPNGKRTGPDVWFRAEIARPGLGGSLSESPGASQGERTQPPGARSLVSGYNLPLQGQSAAKSFPQAEGNTSQPRGTTGCWLSWLELSKAFEEEDGSALARKGSPCLYPQPLGHSTTLPPTAKSSKFALSAYLCARHFPGDIEDIKEQSIEAKGAHLGNGQHLNPGLLPSGPKLWAKAVPQKERRPERKPAFSWLPYVHSTWLPAVRARQVN